jgi:DNA-binding transcriptional LysR family regulator
MQDIPIELLRTFVAVADTGTMVRGARLVDRTPSAVSLQMTKLARLVGQPVLRQEGRVQCLTAAGETLLYHAREILAAGDRAAAAMSDEAAEGPVRFGTVQDLADTVLPSALAEFANCHPAVTLDVHVDTSSVLLDEADAGALDFAVCFESRRASRIIRREPLVWLGRRTLGAVDPIPVAVLQPACRLCDEGIEALRRAGRRHHVALRTPSLSGLRAALEAGFAVASRTPLLRSGNIEVLGPAENLPPLPDVAFALYVPRALSPAARRVARLVRDVVARAEMASEPVVVAVR